MIPSVTLTDIKHLKAHELRKLKSCEVTADGKYLGTFIIPPEDGGMSVTDNLKTQAEYLGHQANSIGGKNLEKVKNMV